MKANDALDREIATEEYLNDSGRDEPVPAFIETAVGEFQPVPEKPGPGPITSGSPDPTPDDPIDKRIHEVFERVNKLECKVNDLQRWNRGDRPAVWHTENEVKPKTELPDWPIKLRPDCGDCRFCVDPNDHIPGCKNPLVVKMKPEPVPDNSRDCYLCGRHTSEDCNRCQENSSVKAGFKPANHASVVGFMIEGVPATARECIAFIQGVQSAEEAAKQPDHAVKVPIERLGAIAWNDFLCIQRLYDKVNELIDRENLMKSNESIRRGE
jgi:hypothetical protein